MTIRYIPRNMVPTGNNDALIRSIDSASICTNQETIPFGDSAIKNALDFKIYDASRPIYRKYRIGTWLNKQKLHWLKTDVPVNQ